jgi:hypothetical protein
MEREDIGTKYMAANCERSQRSQRAVKLRKKKKKKKKKKSYMERKRFPVNVAFEEKDNCFSA